MHHFYSGKQSLDYSNYNGGDTAKYIPLSMRTGKLPYTMKNDYLFKAVLQSQREVLRALLCCLLHMEPKELFSVEISNPIELGAAVDDKGIILDIKMILNNDRILNLEMQVTNYHDWPDRSLLYLCRIFDNLGKGAKSYLGIIPAHHIGILDFPLEKQSEELYGHFYLMNEKTYEKYSDKFCLSVLNLFHIRLATEEDKRYKIDRWAALFKATTWEELQMLAEKDSVFEKAADAIYTLTADEHIREQCRRREEIEAEIQWRENLLNQRTDLLNERTEQLKQQTKLTEQQKAIIQEKDSRIAELEAALAEITKK